jgi:formate--tetrahydrofolate ligase
MTDIKDFPKDITIAQQCRMLPIDEIAAKLGIEDEHLEHYGKYKAKVSLDLCKQKSEGPRGKLVLVSAMTPTPAGEGKTTTSVGLADALNAIGKKTTVCLREPSLGPCFGMKGGAAGGGYSQVVPMEDINLHFTGDFHAIGVAHNLLAAMVDNHIHQGNDLQFDVRQKTWHRVVDLNDRALRQIVVGLGGVANSQPRESGFDITVASEIMAIFCLSQSLDELRSRLSKVIVGRTRKRDPITADLLKAHGAMTVLLRDALKPNLVQTLENNPAIIHGGPFANIAHGCNSIIATKLSMGLSEYTVTEAGFGADLGAEKFLNIKCRKAGIQPDVVVIVATVRALKYHGGVELPDLKKPNPAAVEKGLSNLKKHIENIHLFGLPVVVCINSFLSDTQEEIQVIRDKCAYLTVPIVESNHWEKGGKGAINLARAVVQEAETVKTNFKLLYDDDMTLWEKTQTVAREIYGADDIIADKKLRDRFKRIQDLGYGHFPVCMAKTQYSFSTDAKLRGRPKNFVVPLQDVRLCAGAEFLVVLTGDVLTMPGLPKIPAAEAIDINEKGEVVGLF